MKFENKLKLRLYLAIGYIVLGVILIILFNLKGAENSYLSSMGLALIVVGIVRIRNHIIITKNEESIRKQKIAETDERNIAIANKAKSLSFMIYIFMACIAVIVLEILNKTQWVSVISGMVCLLLVIYWVTYLIVRKTN